MTPKFMTTSILEINDSDIRVYQNDRIVLHSPGYAIIDGDKLALGREAQALARVKPRLTQNRFWHDLSQDSLALKSSHVRHNADLAYAHLLNIHAQLERTEELVIAVPAHYTSEQLSLLLGLVQASPFRATGLVDAAVAAAVTVASSGHYYHLDISLHHASTTRLEGDDQLSRERTELNDAVGLLSIYDKCVSNIADLFIAQTRFDPLHHAETEQALYDQLPRCLARLCSQPEYSFELQYGDRKFQARLKRESIVELLAPLYTSLSSAIEADVPCMLSHRLMGLPGFEQTVEQSIPLTEDAIFKGCQTRLANIVTQGDSLNFVTRLPLAVESPSSEQNSSLPDTSSAHADSVPDDATTAQSSQAVSHILHAGRAWPLDAALLYLSASGAIRTEKTAEALCSISTSGEQIRLMPESGLAVFKNGEQVNDSDRLQAGDMISFSGSKTEFILIDVVANGQKQTQT